MRRLPVVLCARSVLMTLATISWKSSSKIAARPIACGNTVAVPARATPCRDSFHQLYAGMPSRGMAGESKRSWEAFSSSVICATSSCASRRASSRFIIGTFLLSFSKGILMYISTKKQKFLLISHKNFHEIRPFSAKRYGATSNSLL